MSNREMAEAVSGDLIFSTVFMAQDCERITEHDEMEHIAGWCKEMAISRLYLETFRNGRMVERSKMLRLKEFFMNKGFDIAGCITTTGLGKQSTGWKVLTCFTHAECQEMLQKQFEYAASLFDLVIVDDFFYTDCECEECNAARGDRTFPQYRRELMTRLSEERVLKPVRKVNPNVKIILKYPHWYDKYQLRGYDPRIQSRMFDYIFAGTEIRDPDRAPDDLPLVVQYEAYVMMRWLSAHAPGRCLGGWFDSIATTSRTYLEQAVMTVLCGADEAFHFTCRSLMGGQKDGKYGAPGGTRNAQIIKEHLPQLYKLASLIKGKELRGIHAYKPSGSESEPERYVIDFTGMLGLPLIPVPEFPADARAIYCASHGAADPEIAAKLKQSVEKGIPVLVTDGLLRAVPELENEQGPIRLDVNGNPRGIMDMDPGKLDTMRNAMLKPLGMQVRAASRIALFLFGTDMVVLYNFNTAEQVVSFSTQEKIAFVNLLTIPSFETARIQTNDKGFTATLPARTMVVMGAG